MKIVWNKNGWLLIVLCWVFFLIIFTYYITCYIIKSSWITWKYLCIVTPASAFMERMWWFLLVLLSLLHTYRIWKLEVSLKIISSGLENWGSQKLSVSSSTTNLVAEPQLGLISSNICCHTCPLQTPLSPWSNVEVICMDGAFWSWAVHNPAALSLFFQGFLF